MIGQEGCVTLHSSIKQETENCTAVGLALQVGFICSRAMYSQYAKVLKMLLACTVPENQCFIGHWLLCTHISRVY